MRLLRLFKTHPHLSVSGRFTNPVKSMFFSFRSSLTLSIQVFLCFSILPGVHVKQPLVVFLPPSIPHAQTTDVCSSWPFKSWSHGLRHQELQLVVRLTNVAPLLYDSPAWWGFTTAEQRNRPERLLLSLRRGGFLPADSPPVEPQKGRLPACGFTTVWRVGSGCRSGTV